MLKFYIIVIILCAFNNGHSQDNYFQQEVNYNIDVTLNDVSHELDAFEKIEYVNNSNTTLEFIYFHLWPNAYKNNETALAKQLLENDETQMYFAKKEDLGFIDKLNFNVNGEAVKWELDKTHIDICKLFLNKPLKPHDTITITTPFHVKIPSGKLSRLGHIDQAYAITQWYPKPAVFDNQGWHQMPYLNQGEFFSEFGSFDVKITLPKNYLLAATGDRIDELEEEEWLNEKVAETKKKISEKSFSETTNFPESSKEYKTIEFKQYRVHDFAWFADKRFNVLKGEITLPKTLNKVTTWAFFTNNESNLWSKSIQYINNATLYYSQLVGEYPYNHVTAIDGTISAGGGMEYPNITIIGESENDFNLETTILHEVGHNWFYGLLGSNERAYPFLDEGINSYYEMRYIQSKYPNKRLTSLLGKDSTFRFFGLNKFKHKAQYEFSYLLPARKNTDQAISLPSEKYTLHNYGAIVYSKTALAFDYLMKYLGDEKIDAAMQFYFEQWKFKHPNPDDLIKTLQYHLNTDLKWFTEQLLSTNKKLDYKITGHKQLFDKSHAITVKNNNTLTGPISVSGYHKGQLVGTVWYNGFKGEKIFEFPPAIIDEFKIDGDGNVPEINRKNNNYKTHGLFKKSDRLQLNLFGKIDDPHFTQINYLPIMGYNQYNKFMLGCAVYNYAFLQKKIEYTIAPMFAFGSKTVVGYADLTRNFIQNNQFFQQITFTAKAKSFSQNYIDTKAFNDRFGASNESFYLNYYKISETLDFEIKKKNPRSKIAQHIGYTNTNLFVDKEKYVIESTDLSQSKLSKVNIQSYINNLYYTFQNTQIINPYSMSFNFQHNNQFGKLSGEFNYSISIKKQKSFDIRLFAGTFVYQTKNATEDYRFRMSGFSANNVSNHDYLYDYNFIGRNETSGLPGAQFVENDGAFKVPISIGQPGKITYSLGETSKWILALNIKTPKIGILPLKLYADIGTSEFNESLFHEKFLYNAGIDICIFKNILDIYIPLVYSKDIKTNLAANNRASFGNTIRFTLNLHNIKPKTIITNNLF